MFTWNIEWLFQPAMLHDFPPGIGKLARVRWVHTHCLDFKFSCFNCFLINNQKLSQSKDSLHLSLFDYKTRSKTANSRTNDSMFVLNIFFQWHCKNLTIKLSRLLQSTCPQASIALFGWAGPLPLWRQGLPKLWHGRRCGPLRTS